MAVTERDIADQLNSFEVGGGTFWHTTAPVGPMNHVCANPVLGNDSVTDCGGNMNNTILWVIAAILVIVGIVQLIQGQIILGIVLIAAGCIVGPGGYSIFRRRN